MGEETKYYFFFLRGQNRRGEKEDLELSRLPLARL